MISAKRSISVTLGLIVTMFSLQVGHAQQAPLLSCRDAEARLQSLRRREERPCTEVESRRALDEAGVLRSWYALYRSYKSYRQCDDGAIGEGYSESVARILVDHWNTLPQLARLARNDADFRAFVIGHVDATLNMDDVEKIRRNAKAQCPARLRIVCNDLAKQADSALKEDASPH
jgi:hypothetical protein